MMKKYLLSAVVLLISVCCFAQQQVDSSTIKQVLKLSGKRVTGISNNSTSSTKDSIKLITEKASKEYTDAHGVDSTVFITYTSGDSRYVKIQTQAPTASLSGGYAYERHASGTFTVSLSWIAVRQAAGTGVAATNPISSIVVDGISQSFTQPSPGSSATGSKSVTVTYNTNTTYTNIVTTTDSKTASASTSFTVYDKRYLGWATTSTPSDAEILAALYQDNSGDSSNLSYTLSQLGSDKYLFLVTTSTVSSVSVNGFPSTSSFTRNTSRSFTNASGGTFSGYITVSNNAFGSTSSNTVTFN